VEINNSIVFGVNDGDVRVYSDRAPRLNR